MAVVAQEFGTKLDVAHPQYMRRFLLAMGAAESDVPWTVSIDDDSAAAEEARMIQGFDFVELLGRILVGESLGPTVFPAIADALRDSFELAEDSLTYFRTHAIADKRDADVLFKMIAAHARDESARARVVRVIRMSFTQGRYLFYACRHAGSSEYRFAPLYESQGAP
jgi:hypothetical protein